MVEKCVTRVRRSVSAQPVKDAVMPQPLEHNEEGIWELTVVVVELHKNVDT